MVSKQVETGRISKWPIYPKRACETMGSEANLEGAFSGKLM
jgi:hypothetical protein